MRSYVMRWGDEGIPKGPRPGEHGFGTFCQNKRTSATELKPGKILQNKKRLDSRLRGNDELGKGIGTKKAALSQEPP